MVVLMTKAKGCEDFEGGTTWTLSGELWDIPVQLVQ